MRIKKNLEKSKAEGFNVWSVLITFSEIALVLSIVIGVALYIYTYYNLKT